jgi:virginiamycin A acetyltransferase
MKPDVNKIYPRVNDNNTCYLKNIIKNPNIIIGDFTFYNDFVNDPKDFEKRNVLYNYPINP